MAIKYSRLVGEENSIRINSIYRLARNKLPIQFLKQEILLVSIVTLSFVLLIISIFFTSESGLNSSTRENSDGVRFGVVVDCGSSGTRAHVFTWNDKLKGSEDVPPQMELLRDKSTGRALTKHTEPGLSSLSSNPEKASDYMDPIMQFISDTVPFDKHLDTPVYFMATAGLRLLEETVQKKILSDITRDLRVKYDFPQIKSQVITGEYEGIYSWLSLNLDKIYNGLSDRSEKSLGMIEIGGASIQVAFELTPEIEISILKDLKNNDAITAFRSEQLTFNLYRNQSVKLFAATFLGMGVNSARESAIDLLVRDHLNEIGELGKVRTPEELKSLELNITDPCLNEGSSELVMRPSEVSTDTKRSIGFVVREQTQTFKVRLEGSGNFLNCFNLLNRVIQTIKSSKLNCSPGRRSCPMALLGENFIPYHYYPFVGLSEMFFTTNHMMDAAGVFNNSKVLHETNRICSTDYRDLYERYFKSGLVKHQDRILYECFKASWILNVLHRGGFNMPAQYDKFQTVEQMKGREIDWTIGAVISELFLNNRILKS